MNMKKSCFLQRISAVFAVWVMAFLMIFAPVNSVYAAISETQLYENAQNGVYFYKADDCVPSSNIADGSAYNPNEGGWYWNGQCAGLSASIIQNLERDIDAIKAAARQAGVPWELIPAQAINESGWKSELYNDCNNPLGIKGSTCGNGYARYDSVQDAYYAYTQTAVVKDVIATGLYADKPYSFLEYMQYGGKYSYAVCEPGYSFCVGVPDGTPTPHYVNSVSKNVCGIQKWAESNGIEISSETYANFVDPKIDSRIGGVNDGLTATRSDYCRGSSGDWGEGGMRIANAAVALAWPNQDDDTCVKKWDATVLHSGAKDSWISRNGNNEGAIINWSSDPSQCYYSVKPEYAEVKSKYSIGGTDTDCGAFVRTVLYAAGFGDVISPNKSSMYFDENLRDSPLWEDVTDIYNGDTANLLPGDVFHTVDRVGHTYIYVGKIPANVYGNIVAQASQNGQTGNMNVNSVAKSDYYVYRYIGDGSDISVDDETEIEEGE